MIPVEIVFLCYSRGVELYVSGASRLAFHASPGAYTDELRALVASSRADLVALLEAGHASLLAETRTWPEGDHEAFEERAAILEYDAGIPRMLAERRTFETQVSPMIPTAHW